MITIPVYSHLAELSTKEKVEWSLSLLWGVGFALLTIWAYVPYCLTRIKSNRGACLYKLSLAASILFFTYQLIASDFYTANSKKHILHEIPCQCSDLYIRGNVDWRWVEQCNAVKRIVLEDFELADQSLLVALNAKFPFL